MPNRSLSFASHGVAHGHGKTAAAAMNRDSKKKLIKRLSFINGRWRSWRRDPCSWISPPSPTRGWIASSHFRHRAARCGHQQQAERGQIRVCRAAHTGVWVWARARARTHTHTHTHARTRAANSPVAEALVPFDKYVLLRYF